MISAIDTNILLDILIPGAPHAASTYQMLQDAGALGGLIICEVTYAEIGRYFDSDREVEVFLTTVGVDLRRCASPALFSAGKAWLAYTRRRPTELQCAACGSLQLATCENCGTAIRSRQHLLADFLIGAHALTHADQLLTRDRGFYRTYFPDLKLA